MYLPDRIRIEYDGNLHEHTYLNVGKAAHIVDLDTGEAVTNVLAVRIDLDRKTCEATLTFYDAAASRITLREEKIERRYLFPDLAMRAEHHQQPQVAER